MGRAFEIYLWNGLDINYLDPLSSENFWRMNLRISAHKSKINSDNNLHNKSERHEYYRKTTDDSRNDHQYLTVSAQYLYRVYAKHSFRVYAGIGPYLSMNRSYSESILTDFHRDSTTSMDHSISYGIDLGGKLVGGISSSFNQRLYLFAEYQVFFAYNWNKSNYTNSQWFLNGSGKNEYKNGRHASGWSTGLSGIRVGIGFYF